MLLAPLRHFMGSGCTQTSRVVKWCQSNIRACRAFVGFKKCLGWIAMFTALLLATTIAFAQEPANPLKPVDRSSPRAALNTFLDAGDELLVHFWCMTTCPHSRARSFTAWSR